MKSVEEYTEEIFKRSEMKLTRQKKRRNIVISLCTTACAAAAAVTIFANIPPQEGIINNSTNVTDSVTTENAADMESISVPEQNETDESSSLSDDCADKAENNAQVLIALECTSSKGMVTSYSAEYARKAFDLINGFGASKDAQSGNSLTNDMPIDGIETEEKTYTLKFTEGDNYYEYYLNGNKLHDRTNGIILTLSDEELAEIQLVLGIN